MAVKEILLLGNPDLYIKSKTVKKSELALIKNTVDDLHDTMMDFRRRHGFGRAIAAPQIGVRKRLFYMHIDSPVAFINPIMSSKSRDKIEVWDDCMSFPEIFVKLRRHRRIVLNYHNLDWQKEEMELTGDLAVLLQHEYDHLDGILAVSRAIDARSFALRSQKQFFTPGV
jgi:peptide deformylase